LQVHGTRRNSKWEKERDVAVLCSVSLVFLQNIKLQHTYAPFDDNLDKRPLLIQLYKKAKDLA
jgi:hypothetical protein